MSFAAVPTVILSARQPAHSLIASTSDRRVATEAYSEAYSEAESNSFDYGDSADESQQQLMEESMAPEDFCRVCRERVRIASRNRVLMEKWWPNAEEKKFRSKHAKSPPKTETIHKVATHTVESQYSSSEALPQHSSSCLVLLFCTGKHDGLNLIPDYELERCKSICCELMSRGEKSSPEACFAMGRLLTYEGDYEQALLLISEACSLSPDDLFHTWELVVRVLIAKRKPVTEQSKPCKQNSIWASIVAACSTREAKPAPPMLPALQSLACLSIERLWCYFELSLADSESGLGDPRRYASELRDTHRYFGYLAWALVYLRSPDWSRGLDILQELVRAHPHAPEAYLKLWEVYYGRLKDYESAMDTIEQAFVKAADNSQFKLLISLRYAKTMWRLKRVDACFDFLQTQYMEQSCAYMGFLYLYGRLAVQTEDLKERVTGVNALAETIRLACRKRIGLAYYWTAKAHLLAREAAEAVTAFQHAAQLLTSDQAKKINDTRAYLTGMTTFASSLQRLKTMTTVRDGEAAITAQRLLRTASMCDENAGEMEYARVLFHTGMESSALAMLHEVCDRKRDSLTAHMLTMRLLKSVSSFQGMQTEAELCIEKGHNFPISDVIHATVVYAQSLALTGSPYKSLLVLKALGKLHPPVEFSASPYIALIQKASSVTHLAKTPSDHLYRPDLSLSLATAVYKDDFATLLHDIVQITAEEAREKYEPRPTPSTHESPSVFQRSFRSPLNLTLEAVETDTAVLTRRRFALSSDLRFLYEIGKLTVRQGVAHEDGYWALKEYLRIARRRLPGTGSEPAKRVEKARTMMFSLIREVKMSEESMCRQLQYLDTILTSAEKRRIQILADIVCRMTPNEQVELWKRISAHFSRHMDSHEVLANYKIPTKDSTIPKIEAPGTQEFLKSVMLNGGGQIGFMKSVMEGKLSKLLPEGQTLGGTQTPNEKVEVKEEVKEEKTTFNLVVKSYTPESKLKLIKEVKTMLNIGLKEAKDQVESVQKAPLVLYKNISKVDAEAKMKKLKETGAEILME